MDRYLVCSNPKCHMTLDSHVNGESVDGVRRILKKCPECGSAWSPEPTSSVALLQQAVMAHRTV
jgi:hypothetical protein